ncbi:hypothetical protein BDF20DRAFT_906484 [Mycotypha africana]|uniref:uncharacterized protein n=1 Tax=Mycotypha africana TaxID=64632 RepID=UPI0023009AA5|nr:uncharacterized protein BDF20DRAFT_906484 [Mycotypha africana]KAI8977473.1 hypothetical protein BDF20DRAFT_906484 [Mycotypha africana]
MNLPFKNQIKKTFTDHDITDSGMIGGEYLLKALVSLNLPAEESDLPDLLESVGREEEGAVNLDDFIDIVTELQEVDEEMEGDEEDFVMEEVESEKKSATVDRAFQILADPAVNGITIEALKRACAAQKENWTEPQILEMMNEADRDHDGIVDSKDFEALCKRAGII